MNQFFNPIMVIILIISLLFLTGCSSFSPTIERPIVTLAGIDPLNMMGSLIWI